MVEALAWVLFGITAIGALGTWSYFYVKMLERHRRNRAEMKARHKREMAEMETRHDAILNASRNLSPRQSRALLRHIGRSYQLSGETIGDAWRKVGQTMQDVLDACPPLEEAEHMSVTEFEDALDRNLRLLNEKDVDPLAMEKRRRLIESGTLDAVERANQTRRRMNEMRREWKERHGDSE